jgi:hypothetical protein
MRIPKFRNTTRLLRWVSKFHGGKRLPRDREQVFFTVKKEEPQQVAMNLAQYCCHFGKIEEEFENLLKACPDAVLTYARTANNMGFEFSSDLEDSLKGKSSQLYSLACMRGCRLPARLEDTIEHPYFALHYATEVLKGRLPPHLETVFFKDARVASQYAFEVIRGFAPVRLPDELHSFMIMESFANPNDRNIKIYMEASESDPNKIGNSTREV